MIPDPQMQTPGGGLANAETKTTNELNSAIGTRHRKAEATQIAELALAGHAVHKGRSGDYMVCKYGLSRYCQDFDDLHAFARRLGVSK